MSNVSKVSTRFEFFLSRFTLLPELSLNEVELYAASNSASNGTTFKVGYRSKNDTCTPNTHFQDPFRRYFPSGFAILSELVLKWIELYVELNSASNGTIYKLGYRAKSGTWTPNTHF